MAKKATRVLETVLTLDIMLNMKMKIAPLLQRYEETPLAGRKQLRMRIEDEVTFAGPVYKSILLDLVGDNRNSTTSCTKVLNETSDDE